MEIKGERKNNEAIEIGFYKIIRKIKINLMVFKACRKFQSLLLNKRKEVKQKKK